jgi:hypothetical protein
MYETAEATNDLAFVRQPTLANSPKLCFLIAFGFFAAAIAGFAFAIVLRVNRFSLHAMTTLPCMFSIAALGLALTLRRSPRRVVVDSTGVTLDSGSTIRTIPWSEIGYANVKQIEFAQRRVLSICDCSGKKIAAINDGFDDFDQLRDLILAKVASRPDDVAERIRMRRAKRAALGAVALGGGMLVACAFIARTTYDDQRAAALLASAGVPGEAEIMRRFVAPNGVTTRIEYKISADSGKSATRNAEVERAVWDQLKDEPTVRVVYVPDEPSISRLALGEPPSKDITDTPAGGYGLAGLGMLMGIFSFGAGAMFWRGLDFGTDPVTGKLGFKRFGPPQAGGAATAKHAKEA